MFAVRYLKSTTLPGREQTVAQMMEAQHREDTEAETSAQAAALGNMARVRVRDIGGGYGWGSVCVRAVALVPWLTIA